MDENTKLKDAIKFIESVETAHNKKTYDNRVELQEAIKIIDHPDEKLYILLIKYNNDERDWFTIRGRQLVFDYLVELISKNPESIDIDNSYIMSSTQEAGKSLTVYRFMKFCIDQGYVRCDPERIDLEELHYEHNEDVQIFDNIDIHDLDD